jgi:hypothetical protein
MFNNNIVSNIISFQTASVFIKQPKVVKRFFSKNGSPLDKNIRAQAA